MVGVEVQDNFQVAAGYLQAFVRFALGAHGARPIDGDVAGQKLLRNEDGKSLCSAAIPVIDTSQHSILVVEVVVEDDDERGVEGKVLLKGMGGADLDVHLRHVIDESDVGAAVLAGL